VIRQSDLDDLLVLRTPSPGSHLNI
jgi:hypothetical protein